MNQTPTHSYQIWHDVLADARFGDSGRALQDYLSLTSGLESPIPYHVWSFLSLTAALCGDNIALTNGPMGRERLNLGVVLTGVPALRKSTALTLMQKFAEGLPIAYGPTDTAGQRQGIMSAMMPRWQKDSHEETISDLRPSTLEALASLDTDSIVPELPNPLTRKASEIYFVAKELGRLISSPSRELFDFFTDGMDGESFHYQLKNQSIKIKHPLINLIGATTQVSLGQFVPKGGDAHGFLSRLIFVHANKLTRAVALPDKWNELQLQTRKQLHDLLYDQLGRNHEVVDMSAAATETFTDLYGYIPATVDQRLQAYHGRRAKHLLKVSTLLAILRGQSQVRVIASDVRLAHVILVLTEMMMDRAFFGLDTGLLSKVLCAVSEIAENNQNETVSMQDVLVFAGHLGEKDRIHNVLMSLEEQGKLVKMKTEGSSYNWQLNQAQIQIHEKRARTVFNFGDKPVGVDEFRTWRSQKMQIVKGAAG